MWPWIPAFAGMTIEKVAPPVHPGQFDRNFGAVVVKSLEGLWLANIWEAWR